MHDQRDILKEIANGQVSVDEVEALFEREPLKAWGSWGLTRVEYTAYCHGAGFDVLAEWRYNGWPSRCTKCKNPLPVLEEFGWFVVSEETTESEGNVGRLGLKHIDCLPDLPGEGGA